MGIFARIENGVVAEVIATERDIGELFHPAMGWVETAGREVAAGFAYVEGVFVAPPAEVAAPVVDTVASLQAQIAELAARVAALANG